MQPRQPSSEHRAPVAGGARRGARFFARVLQHLPASTPPVERQLLRSAYEVHRTTDALRRDPTAGRARRLAAAIDGLEATAAAAIEAGVPPSYVRQLVAMTLAAAEQLPEIAGAS